MQIVQRRMDRLGDVEETFGVGFFSKHGSSQWIEEEHPGLSSVGVQQARLPSSSQTDLSQKGTLRPSRMSRIQQVAQTCKVSMRFLVVVVTTILVLLACSCMYVPEQLLVDSVLEDIMNAYKTSIGLQRDYIDLLLEERGLSSDTDPRAVNLAQAVDSQIASAEDRVREHTKALVLLGLGVALGLLALSAGLSCVVGYMVSAALRDLSEMMSALAELDIQRSGDKIRNLQMGHRSRVADVRDLQESFLLIYRGMDAFVRFVPETTVKGIIQGDHRATRLHVDRRLVTIMFTDIKDFTTISEMLDQQDLLFLLTRYFSVMTRIINSFGGVVAEILGDGLLCFWNTPDDCQDHAAKACAAALAMCQALELLSSEFAELSMPSLSIRIGIHTGSVLSGNIGSEIKMKFGCIGDPVNLAARLEGLCKFYGVSVLCSSDTYRRLPSHGFICRRIDLVQVKGKVEPTEIWEVLDCEIPTVPSEAETSRGTKETAIRQSFTRSLSKTNVTDLNVGPMMSVYSGSAVSGISSAASGNTSGQPGTPGAPATARPTLSVRVSRHMRLSMAAAVEAIDDSNKGMRKSRHTQNLLGPVRKKLTQRMQEATSSTSLGHFFGGLVGHGHSTPAATPTDAAPTKLPHAAADTAVAAAAATTHGTDGEKPKVNGEPSKQPQVTFQSSRHSHGTSDGEEEAKKLEKRSELIMGYEAALSAFQRADFLRCRELCEDVLKDTDDGPTKRLLERAAQYIGPDGRITLTPEELGTWNGMSHMTQK